MIHDSNHKSLVFHVIRIINQDHFFNFKMINDLRSRSSLLILIRALPTPVCAACAHRSIILFWTAAMILGDELRIPVYRVLLRR